MAKGEKYYHRNIEGRIRIMPKRQQKEWLSQDTLNLLQEIRQYKTKRKENAATAKHYNYLCRTVKRSAKEDKEHLIRSVCKEVQDARIQNKTKAVYEGVRKITCKQAPQVKIIKDKGGMVLTAPTAVKERWKEYFDELYNDPNAVDEDILNEFSDSRNVEEIPDIGEHEVKAAISRMKCGKAPGIDNITTEELVAST